MAVRILMTKDINGYATNSQYGRQFSNLVYSVTLVAATPQPVTIPEGVNVIFFRYTKDADVFVGYNGGATPTGTGDILLEDAFKILLEDADDLLLEGSGIFSNGLALNPDVRWVKPGDSLVLISAQTPTVVIEMYNLLQGGLQT